MSASPQHNVALAAGTLLALPVGVLLAAVSDRRPWKRQQLHCCQAPFMHQFVILLHQLQQLEAASGSWCILHLWGCAVTAATAATMVGVTIPGRWCCITVQQQQQ
jgi:hypothetical protein